MRTRNLGIAVVITMMSSSIAFAKSEVSSSSSPVSPVQRATVIAGDIQVVNPTQPAPAPVAVPAQTTVVQPQPAVAAPGTQRVVEADVDHPHNYMGTIAVSAILGGVAGVLVGGSIYYLGNHDNARNIGFWAAGGVLVGTAVGITQVLVTEDRANRVVGYADPAPTYRLALVNLRF